MKSFKFTSLMTLTLLGLGCSCNHLQTGTKKNEINTEQQAVKKTSIEEQRDTSNGKLTHDVLYSIGETRRDSLTRIASDSATLKKSVSEKIGNNFDLKYIQYKGERIIAVVHRIIDDQSKKKITNSVFYFDEENNCMLNIIRDSNEPMSYTYDMNWNKLIKYDVDYNVVDIDTYEKQKVINSTKASLDSIMRYFPEFRYQFNWK